MLHPVDQGGQAFRVGAVVGLASFGAVADEPGVLQDAQVLGDRRLRDPGVVGQRAHGLLALADEAFEDRARSGHRGP